MCGIWLRAQYKNKIDSSELLHPVQMLSHRGPDGYGWWKDEQVALLHTRLSIIDLLTGAQPLQSFDQKWIGVVNGELYDYQNIRQSLLERGVKFESQSDSEVLLNLYALDGAEGLKNVSGEFSFIFYSPMKQQVHFARDLFGVKPLFFAASPDSFTLSSEMKALQNEAPAFDPEYLKTFLARAITPPQTCLQNVQHVWPGRVYCLDLQTKQLSWQNYQPLPLFQQRFLRGQEAEERLEQALKSSVRKRLIADVRVGCYLSGGIDSALVAALAADQGARPQAFTVGFADRDFDESKQAASIAADLGLQHTLVQLNSKNFMDSLIQSIVAFENPITNPHGAAKNLLAHEASQHVKVVLSGEGSDEWFGGYAYFRIQKIKQFAARHPKISGQVLQQFLQREMGVSLKHLDGESDYHNQTSAQYFAGKSPILLGRLAKNRFYQHIVGESLAPKIKDICEALGARLREENPSFQFSEWDLNSWMSIRSDLLHYILANVGDRQEMAHSVEGRTPFLDQEVVTVAGQIECSTLLRSLKEKYILRKIGRKYLKLEDSQRSKKPFFAPMKYLYLKENRQVVQDYLQVAKQQTPWLQWKHIEHFINSEQRSHISALESSRISLMLILFSVGVLAKHLRQNKAKARGYKIPDTLHDLKAHERVFHGI